MRALVLAATIAIALIAAPAASAAFGISQFSAQPASKAAGANSDFSVSFDVSDPGAGLRDLTVHLPPGLIGNPLATPTCSEAKLKADACPAKSDVGDATNGVNVKPLGLLPIPLTVNGQVYNVEPRKGEPARFGIVLDPSPVPGLGGALPKIVLQQTASLRQGDFGLDTGLKDIPRSAKIAGISTPLEVTSVELTLKGKVNGGKGFLRNPTSCGAQTVSIDAKAYNGANASGQDQFTTTNCGALPFSPKFAATIRQVSRDLADPVELTTSISQTIEEAGLEKAVVKLPTDIIGNGPALAIQCEAAAFDAGNCPADTKVGEATAASPLQAKPLAGSVYLVKPVSPSPFPDLGVDLKGGLALKVKGAISAVAVPSGLQIVVTFDGLPDIPLSDFSLTFAGGPGGLNVAGRDPCQPPPFVFGADFDAHSGAARHVDANAKATCKGGGAGRPKARVGIAKLRSGHPKLKLRVRAGGEQIRRARVRLPRGLKVGPKRKLLGGSHAAGGSVRGHGRTLSLKAKGGGADRLRVRLAKGAIKAGKGVRAKRLKAFRIRVVDTSGSATALSVRAAE
ncbi:MAG: hypothetical protein R2718_04790 [Solirubrobacterales bacterium]|nr:hypothetical protein [Solirubrobacterales bacterium]